MLFLNSDLSVLFLSRKEFAGLMHMRVRLDVFSPNFDKTKDAFRKDAHSIT